jgi:hypothetical protein
MADATSGWEIAGTIADIVAGIGTAGALVVAVIVYRRQVQYAHVDQASRVFLTLVAADDGFVRELIVENASDLPIFRADVYLISNGFEESPSRSKPHRVYILDHLPGKKSITYDDFAGSHEVWNLVASISFKDAAGREWNRDSYGDLTSFRSFNDPAPATAALRLRKRIRERWRSLKV